MNEQRVTRMLRELRADPIDQFYEWYLCDGRATPKDFDTPGEPEHPLAPEKAEPRTTH